MRLSWACFPASRGKQRGPGTRNAVLGKRRSLGKDEFFGGTTESEEMEMATTRVKREEDCVVCELVVALEADGSLCYYRQAQRKEKKNRRRIRYPATGTIKEDKRMEMATTRVKGMMVRDISRKMSALDAVRWLCYATAFQERKPQLKRTVPYELETVLFSLIVGFTA